MKLIAEKYKSLRPEISYLSDEVIIAQAWKKTHQYIRQHNWYSDTLALDISALGLEKNAKKWSSSLANNFSEEKSNTFPIELVPAPKSEPWDILTTWQPKTKESERKESPPIRPLAHITIRDQTCATALMMCVADAVETAQGDCSEQNFFVAQKNSVFSYGNRLLCDWKDKKAWFRWGNGEIYRKFFTDYQNFLKRPLIIGREVSRNHSDSDHVFVVNLDISKFYDHIDRKTLLDLLSKISRDFYGIKEDEFWSVAKRVTNWQWDTDSHDIADEIGLIIEDKGLPQGLVAAGFLANAYLVNFDKSVGTHIGKSTQGLNNVVIHDYCRYVDDLRLVISIEDDDIESAKKVISSWINDHLSKHTHSNLKINPSKTKITSLSDLDNTGSLAGRVGVLQAELSGPMDRDSLDGAMGLLEGLLDTKSDGLPNDDVSEPLLKLARFDNDIKSDTLKRFAANRLELVMRYKRKLSASEIDFIDNESELLARKLIRAWMQDPSLAVVLRKAFEIFPSPSIAEAVFEAVFKKTGKNTEDKITTAIMNYLLADLFRCCIDFNGIFQKHEYPKTANPEAFLDVGASYAQKIINENSSPKFLKRQASLLLATLNRPIYFSTNTDELIQDSLHAILVGRNPRDTYQVYALYEVAAQITDKPDTIAALLIAHLDKFDDERRNSILEDFAKRGGGGFWLSIWNQLKKLNNKKDLAYFRWSAPQVIIDPRPTKQRLSKVIISEKNGFEHESALIKLGLGLIKFAVSSPKFQAISPNEISVNYDNERISWDKIWMPEVNEIIVTAGKINKDPRFEIPHWINRENQTFSENSVIYWIGAILRAAAVGGDDFTGNRWKSNVKTKSYKGLKTGWYKRRMGMMYSSEALVGEYATLSNWISELLMKCLQWPGVQSSFLSTNEINNIVDLNTLKKTLADRLNYLNANYCESSKMPTLFTKVNRLNARDRGFRLVTVQQLLPKTNDFSLADPKLDFPVTRAKNRDHLSRICHLTYKTLMAKLNAEGDKISSGADLIVFPEVAIHPDDQDIIKRLADKTKSIIFAGMVFMDHKGSLVNNGRWFIPDYQPQGRRWIIRDQGKASMTHDEIKLGISAHRPCQHILEIHGHPDGPFKITGAICYDATDLKLASDLRDKTDLFVVCAHNKDVSTFDTMASALNYHMYQHIVVVNKGEFGGSTIQAPYRESYDRLISHAHGNDQISINLADLDLAAFRRPMKKFKEIKYKPAGM